MSSNKSTNIETDAAWKETKQNLLIRAYAAIATGEWEMVEQCDRELESTNQSIHCIRV